MLAWLCILGLSGVAKAAPVDPPLCRQVRLADVGWADVTATTQELGRRLQSGLEALQRLPEHQPRPGEWAPWHPAHLGGDGVERRASYELDGMPRSAVVPVWGPGTE